MKVKSTLLRCFAFLGFFLLTLATWAQTAKTVKGSVTDSQNALLPGVNILLKGTTTGTVTDFDGNFQLTVPDANAVLVFSFIGHEDQEITVGNQPNLKVVMKEASLSLNEVIVVGYGVQKKSDLTGAVGSLKSEEIQKMASNNALQAMQGKVAGLDITQSSGQAGSGLKINLRGNRSISASNDPLIMVDGIEYGSTLDISPSDIESMEVLKDAASTAIYGSRGANGVILITTKKGKAGSQRISINSYLSVNQPTNIPKVFDSEGVYHFLAERSRADAENKAYATNKDYLFGSGVIPTADVLWANTPTLDLYNAGKSVNWFDELFQTGYTQNYDASVAGGTDKTTYNFSLGLMDEASMVANDRMKRYNLKLNLEQKISDKLKVGAGAFYTFKDWNKRAGGNFTQALKVYPIATIFDDAGNYVYKPSPLNTAHSNPLLNELEDQYVNQVRSNRLFASSYLDWKIVEGLSFHTSFGVDINADREGVYDGELTTSHLDGSAPSTAYVTSTNSYQWTLDNVLTYNKVVDKHDFTVMLGQSAQKYHNEWFKVAGSGQATSASQFFDLGALQSTSLIATSNATETAMASYFGRLNYKFNEKYLLQATVRYDASSVLAAGNKGGMFPSVSAGWRVKEESFLQDQTWLTNLKLRASWGLAGSSAVKAYGTQTVLSSVPVYYTFNNGLSSGYMPFQMGNKALKWETTETTNIGLDFGILENRISGSVDYYMAKTFDLLLYKAIPASTGYQQVLDNVGETKGSGLEIVLNTVNVKSDNFNWTSDWTFAWSKDEVVALASGLTSDPSNNLFVGQPVKVFYDYEKVGIWQIADLAAERTLINADPVNYDQTKTPMTNGGFVPGDVKLTDMNGDGKLDDFNDRKTFNQTPKFTFGWSNNLSYKGFDLSLFFYGRFGHYISYEYYDSYKMAVNENGAAVNYWTPENSGGDMPRPGTNNGSKAYTSAMKYVKGDFFKIKDLTVSYTLPKSVISSIGLSKVKFYTSLKNYFTFSGIDNYDPERGGQLSFPLAKQTIFGVNIEF